MGRLLRGRRELLMDVSMIGTMNEGMAFGIAFFFFSFWSRHTRVYGDEFVNDDTVFK